MALGASDGSCRSGSERVPDVDGVDVDREVLTADLGVVVVPAGVGRVERRSTRAASSACPTFHAVAVGSFASYSIRRELPCALRGQPAAAERLQLGVAHRHRVDGVGRERLRVARTRAIEVGPDAPADDETLGAGHVVGHAEPRPEDRASGRCSSSWRCPRPPRTGRCRRLPVPGTSVPTAALVFGPRNWPVTGFMAWRLFPVHGIDAVGAAVDVDRRRVRHRRSARAGSCRPASGCRTAAWR